MRHILRVFTVTGINRHILLLAATIVLFSCSGRNTYSVVAVQSLNTSWDNQLLTEFKREATFHQEIEFTFETGAKSGADEARIIEKAVEKGVDALIVNPIDQEILPAIEMAYDQDIRVVLVGDKLPTDKYDAYVGTDNVALGRMAAQYVVDALPQGGNIIEIVVPTEANFYRERVEAFNHIIDEIPEIAITGVASSFWDKDEAHEQIDSLKAVLEDKKIDLIFAFGEDMAIGASESNRYPDAIFVGIDGIDDTGIKAVKDGIIDATFTNNSGGHESISIISSILRGLPYEKDFIIQPMLVTKDNVDIIIKDKEDILQGQRRIDLLTDVLENSRKKDNSLTAGILFISFILFILILLILWAVKVSVANKKHLDEVVGRSEELEKQYQELSKEKEKAERIRWQLEAERDALLEADKGDSESNDIQDALFITRFRKAVEEHIDNAELTVDQLAFELGVSRAQLFRRIKSDSGYTPNELLQTMRLDKADRLLKTTEMSVSEVAYSVGFSSPSYFAKCYKSKFGVLPSESRP